MNILLIGLGSIGKRHLANVKKLVPESHVTVWRHQPALPQSPDESAGFIDQVVYTLEEALESKPEIALIASPASKHIEVANILAEHDIHLFIEKPISHSLEGIDMLLETCNKQGLVLLVGYNFRFYKPFQKLHQVLTDGDIGRPIFLRAEVGQYLPDWRPGKDYQKSVSAQSCLGGGAVLELSHELDYVRWFMGELRTVNAQVSHLSDLDIDVEDSAEIILNFENGAVGNIHLDMIQQPPRRQCRIVGTKGTLTWNGLDHRVCLFSNESQSWSEIHPATELDRNEMYLEELQHFLNCVAGQASPLINGEDGRRVLEMALAAKQSSEQQQVIQL